MNRFEILVFLSLSFTAYLFISGFHELLMSLKPLITSLR